MEPFFRDETDSSTPVAVPQHVLDWARQQFREEEVAAGIREIRETGGHSLADFYHELDPPARP